MPISVTAAPAASFRARIASISASAALISAADRAGVGRPSVAVPIGMYSRLVGLDRATKSGVAAICGPAPIAEATSRTGLKLPLQPATPTTESIINTTADARWIERGFIRIVIPKNGNMTLENPTGPALRCRKYRL